MDFVIGGFLGLAMACAIVWLGIFLFVRGGEMRRNRAAAALRQREKLLRDPAARLRCAACNVSFPGPLPEDGCPECHCASFVEAEPAEAQRPPLTKAQPESAQEEIQSVKAGQSE